MAAKCTCQEEILTNRNFGERRFLLRESEKCRNLQAHQEHSNAQGRGRGQRNKANQGGRIRKRIEKASLLGGDAERGSAKEREAQVDMKLWEGS